jgi:TetR/AcrR family transcriptional repressor of nem operon
VADVKHFDPDRVLEVAELVFWRRGDGSTGIQDLLTATGLSRSSLYNSFGGKGELYEQAMRRYVDKRSRPMFARLAADARGLDAISGFFFRLIRMRCSGEFAGWGCLVSNAHLEDPPPGAKSVLDEHQAALRNALHAALKSADDQGQLRSGLDLAATAEHLTLLAYAINLRSRAGVQAGPLHAAVRGALAPLAA